MDVLETFDFSIVVPILLNVLGALVLLVLTFLVAGWAGRSAHRAVDRSNLDPTLAQFFGSLARYAVLVLGGLAVLSLFGISVASFAAILAAVGFAIGLALQGTLSHFASGVMLLLFRPFKVGDVITTASVTGKVEAIGLFTTNLDTADNRRLIVPNGEISGKLIENITYHDTRRVDVAVGTDYSADLAETRAVLEAAAASVEGRIDMPAPQVYLSQLGGSSIDWSVRVWAKTSDFWAVRERLTNDVKYALDARGIGIPFPQMDVHLDTLAPQGNGSPAATQPNA
jgi:small conductance mechanosensitive channel